MIIPLPALFAPSDADERSRQTLLIRKSELLSFKTVSTVGIRPSVLAS